jgi:hypothetical protein
MLARRQWILFVVSLVFCSAVPARHLPPLEDPFNDSHTVETLRLTSAQVVRAVDEWPVAVTVDSEPETLAAFGEAAAQRSFEHLEINGRVELDALADALSSVKAGHLRLSVERGADTDLKRLLRVVEPSVLEFAGVGRWAVAPAAIADTSVRHLRLAHMDFLDPARIADAGSALKSFSYLGNAPEAAIRAASALPALRYLHVELTEDRLAEELRHVQPVEETTFAPTLRVVRLSRRVWLQDAFVTHLLTEHELAELHIDGCMGVTADSIAALTIAHQLEGLTLRPGTTVSASWIDDVALVRIAQATNLRRLSILASVSEGALSSLVVALPGLTHLEVFSPLPACVVIRCAEGAEFLKWLSVSCSVDVTVHAKELTNHAHIRALHLSGCMGLRAEHFASIAQWPRLERLGLFHCDAGADAVVAIAESASLTAIKIAFCWNLEGDVVQHLQRARQQFDLPPLKVDLRPGSTALRGRHRND